ncbi:MAG: GlsB/YeaQ/YmgE family stress response membrane protein [Beijerinckiaceae bacterium]
MHMSNEGLIVTILVGLVAGWLSGQLVRGAGFGLIGDILVGVVGAFIGAALLPRLGVHLGAGLVAAIVNATLGAVVLLLIIRLFRGGPRWSARW